MYLIVISYVIFHLKHFFSALLCTVFAKKIKTVQQTVIAINIKQDYLIQFSIRFSRFLSESLEFLVFSVFLYL